MDSIYCTKAALISLTQEMYSVSILSKILNIYYKTEGTQNPVGTLGACGHCLMPSLCQRCGHYTLSMLQIWKLRFQDMKCTPACTESFYGLHIK